MADNNKLKFNIQGMSCAACVARVDKATRETEGVVDCSVNLLTNSMEVTIGDAKTTISDTTVEKSSDAQSAATPSREAISHAISLSVSKAGYKAIEVATDIDGEEKVKNINDSYKRDINNHIARLVSSGVLLLLLMYVAMGHHMFGLPLPQVMIDNPLIGAVIQAILCFAVMCINHKFFINGAKGFLHLSPNMDSLVMLGSLVSFGLSVYLTITGEHMSLYYDSAAMILVFITIGKLLEAISKSRTGNALEALIQMSPKMANVVINGEEKVIPASKLKVGDVCRVYMGEMIPADGVILEGNTAIDESALTGESKLANKSVGDNVFSATNNYKDNFLMKVEAVGEDTSFGKIITIVENASASKAPISRLADKIASYFVPAVIIIALITFIIWLILGADMVTAIIHGVSVLVVSCPCALGLATPVAIMVGNGKAAKSKILFKSAAIMEIIGSTKSVVFDKTGTITRGIPKGLTVKEYDTMQDEIKPDSAFTVGKLQEMGIDTYLLSGDRGEVAKDIGAKAGIKNIISDVLPDGKSSHVEEIMKAEYARPVMMVGDGINDAPALSVADIGVAIGSGTDIAIDSGDVVLQGDSIVDVVNAILIGKKTLRVIRQNLFWAFIYNVIGIPIAAGALSGIGIELTPELCALFMSFSSICVVLNALRLNGINLISFDNNMNSGRNASNISPNKELSVEKNTQIFDNIDTMEGDNMIIKIEGMMCPHCEAHCKEELEKLDFVVSATPSHEKAEAVLEIDDSKYDESTATDALKSAVEAAGYKMVG